MVTRIYVNCIEFDVVDKQINVKIGINSCDRNMPRGCRLRKIDEKVNLRDGESFIPRPRIS